MTNDPAFPIIPRFFHARVTACGFEKLKQSIFDEAQACQLTHRTAMVCLDAAGIHAPGDQVGTRNSSWYLKPRDRALAIAGLPLTGSDLVRTPADQLSATGEPCDFVTITPEAFARLKADTYARHVLDLRAVFAPDDRSGVAASIQHHWPDTEMEPEYFLGAVKLPLEHADFEFVPARLLPAWARKALLRYYVEAQDRGAHMHMPPWWPDVGSPWGDVRFDDIWVRRAEKPGCVMVLLSLEHARTGRWTFMRAGRWLTKFAAHLDENEKRALAERFMRASTPHDAEALKLEITSRAERARWAYTRMAHCVENTSQVSCMYDAAILDMNPHPAEAYVSDDPRGVFGPDDLGIAILVDPASDVPLARAVVWPAKRTFVRIYGAEQRDAVALQNCLETAGYKRAKNFAGARMRRIESEPEYILAPYLDGDTKGVRIGWCDLTIVGSDELEDADRHFDSTTGRAHWKYA